MDIQSKSYNYSDKYYLPTPVISLTITNPDNEEIKATDVFVVDSGSDRTQINQDLFDKLKLEYTGTISTTDHKGEKSTQRQSWVTIISDFGKYELVEVIISQGESLLGRDIMNHWKIILDGKEEKMEIIV